MRFALLVSTLLISMGTFCGLSADDGKGEQIARRYFDLKSPDNTTAEASMTLIDRNGNERSRVLRINTMTNDDGTHTFMEFLSPADVRGTRFLSLPDEQRIFLPALNRVRLIASSGRGGKFVGSDFFFYDLEDRSFEDYTYRFIRSEKEGEQEFDVIEMKPKKSDTPYSRAESWVDRSDNFVYKMKLYDQRSENHVKTMTVIDTKVVDGCIIPVTIDMENIRDNHRTVMSLSDLEVNKGVDESVFTVRNLESR